jgi:2-desacetyl-2-hydroxyethyl bacteriochlorophyllide A dehydrogenase
MNARAVVFESVNTVKTVEFTLDALAEGEMLVEVAHSVISPGTELRCLAGKQPGAAEWGFVPGYTCAGYDETGTAFFCSGTKHLSLPRMWGGHVSHAIVDKSSVVKLPDGLSTSVAPVARLAAIALRGVITSQPSQGESVAVVGLGMIGQLSARLFKQAGASVIAFDTDPHRVRIAKQAGIEAVLIQGEVADAAKQARPELFTTVVEATGVQAVVSGLHRLMTPLQWGDSELKGRKLVVQASYPETFALPYQEYFGFEANIFMPRDCRPADIRHCMSLMGSGELQVDDLVSEVLPASDAHVAYGKLVDREPGYTTAAFDWKA